MQNSVLEEISEEKTNKLFLRSTIKHYLEKAQEIESYLSCKPQEWGKFQAEFNREINNVFSNIMHFEKTNLSKNYENKVYKLKHLFINRVRKIFLRGEFITWSLEKPFGYAGDFKIIDEIYRNNPTTQGFDRLFDNYFQMSAISVAVRNRKEDFKRLILNFIRANQDKVLRIMNLACGPAREIKEILSLNKPLCRNVIFDCYDNEQRALRFAKLLLKDYPNINFIKENAVKIAIKKDIYSLIDKRYDFIYSTGLFDYLGEKIAIRLIQNLKNLLKPGGVLAISNVRDKYSNPSVHFMEWVGEWYLVYRDDENFRKIFFEAGFEEDALKTQYEQQGIMQYIIASNK